MENVSLKTLCDAGALIGGYPVCKPPASKGKERLNYEFTKKEE